MRELAIGELVAGAREGDLQLTRDLLFKFQAEPLQERLQQINTQFRSEALSPEVRSELEQEFMVLQRQLALLRKTQRKPSAS